MRLSILSVVLALLPASTATAQSPGPPEPPGDVMLLVQSELEYLAVAGQRVSINFRKASPARVLGRLGKKVRLSIEIHRRLPEEPRLTATFRHVTVKEVLEWFAREVGVYYKAESPDKLLVLAPGNPANPGEAEAD